LATANALIIVPVPGRDAHAGVSGARPRDVMPAPSIDAVRLAGSPSDSAHKSAPASERRPQPPRESWTRVVHPEPQGTIPFLAQQLAQEGRPPAEADDGETEAMPSVLIAARQAYAAARDSTIEFLSPTPLFDLRV
jgi:hypothetical protein